MSTNDRRGQANRKPADKESRFRFRDLGVSQIITLLSSIDRAALSIA